MEVCETKTTSGALLGWQTKASGHIAALSLLAQKPQDMPKSMKIQMNTFQNDRLKMSATRSVGNILKGKHNDNYVCLCKRREHTVYIDKKQAHLKHKKTFYIKCKLFVYVDVEASCSSIYLLSNDCKWFINSISAKHSWKPFYCVRVLDVFSKAQPFWLNCLPFQTTDCTNYASIMLLLFR